MFQFLKKYKQLMAGIMIGSVVTTAGVASANQTVSAYLMNGIKFTFNGVERELPAPYKVLNYEGSSYVPARFVAEQMGASVQFENNTVKIYQPDLLMGKTPTSSTPPADGSGTAAPHDPYAPQSGNPYTPSVPVDDGRSFGVYKEVATKPVKSVSELTISIPATYKLESNFYSTRVVGEVRNDGTDPRDVIINVEFFDKSEKKIGQGMGVVRDLRPGQTRVFRIYADERVEGVDSYLLSID